jgi:hypothetical protein
MRKHFVGLNLVCEMPLGANPEILGAKKSEQKCSLFSSGKI